MNIYFLNKKINTFYWSLEKAKCKRLIIYLFFHCIISSLYIKSPFSCLQPKNKVTIGNLNYLLVFLRYYFSCRYALNGAKPVPADINITFFHFIASVKVDFLSSILKDKGYLSKNLENNPFYVILAAITTFCWVLWYEAIVNNLGAIESDNYIKS